MSLLLFTLFASCAPAEESPAPLDAAVETDGVRVWFDGAAPDSPAALYAGERLLAASAEVQGDSLLFRAQLPPAQLEDLRLRIGEGEAATEARYAVLWRCEAGDAEARCSYKLTARDGTDDALIVRDADVVARALDHQLRLGYLDRDPEVLGDVMRVIVSGSLQTGADGGCRCRWVRSGSGSSAAFPRHQGGAASSSGARSSAPWVATTSQTRGHGSTALEVDSARTEQVRLVCYGQISLPDPVFESSSQIVGIMDKQGGRFSIQVDLSSIQFDNCAECRPRFDILTGLRARAATATTSGQPSLDARAYAESVVQGGPQDLIDLWATHEDPGPSSDALWRSQTRTTTFRLQQLAYASSAADGEAGDAGRAQASVSIGRAIYGYSSCISPYISYSLGGPPNASTVVRDFYAQRGYALPGGGGNNTPNP